MASQGRVQRLAERGLSTRLWTEGVAPFAILLFALSAASLNLGEQMAKFPLLKEAGYPDSYILYDVPAFSADRCDLSRSVPASFSAGTVQSHVIRASGATGLAASY